MAKTTRRELTPDPKFNNILVAKLTNYVMRQGQKQTARKVVYDAFEIVKEKSNQEPMDVMMTAFNNARPLLEIRPRRIGGAVYQVPKEVDEHRGIILAMRWILESARKKKGKPMAEKLAHEILECANNQGDAIRKRENVHKMAEANKSFAHLG